MDETATPVPADTMAQPSAPTASSPGSVISGILSAASTANFLFGGGTSSSGRSFGDYTLIAVGIILAIGALLISQKETVVQVASTAAKAAA